jgi:hypothetical protein
MVRGHSKIGRGSSPGRSNNEECDESSSRLISLTLDCKQGCIEDFTREEFEWEVEVLPNYKKMPTVLVREVGDRAIIYELTYHGSGNKFVDEFPEAESEYDFIGFCYYEDNPKRKGNFNAKIISGE